VQPANICSYGHTVLLDLAWLVHMGCLFLIVSFISSKGSVRVSRGMLGCLQQNLLRPVKAKEGLKSKLSMALKGSAASPGFDMPIS